MLRPNRRALLVSQRRDRLDAHRLPHRQPCGDRGGYGEERSRAEQRPRIRRADLVEKAREDLAEPERDTSPTTIPTSVRLMLSRIICVATAARFAPSAIRTPICLVRREIRKAFIP